MTPDEARYVGDERYNVYLALELDDADILFVLGSRAIANGATDIEAFTEGYARALAGESFDHPADASFIKGYEAARSALRLSQHDGESHASPSPAQQA